MVSAATPTAGIWVAFFSRCQPDNIVADRCREHGVGILAHSTLGKGLLTGRYKAGHEWSPDDERSNMVDFHGAFWGLFRSLCLFVPILLSALCSPVVIKLPPLQTSGQPECVPPESAGSGL